MFSMLLFSFLATQLFPLSIANVRQDAVYAPIVSLKPVHSPSPQVVPESNRTVDI